MEISQKILIETYKRKNTDELLTLHRSGELTTDAYDALEFILKSRGIEPSPRPTLPNNTKPVYQSDWSKFFTWLFIAFLLFLTARSILDPKSDSIIVVSPLKEFIAYTLAYAAEFIIVFIIVSIPTVAFNRFGKYSVKASMPKLLRITLIWTLVIEAIIIISIIASSYREI